MDKPYDLSKLTPAPVTVYDVINTALIQHYGSSWGQTQYMCFAVERLAELGNISWKVSNRVTSLIMSEIVSYDVSYLRNALENRGIDNTQENRNAFWWFFVMKHGDKVVNYA